MANYSYEHPEKRVIQNILGLMAHSHGKCWLLQNNKLQRVWKVGPQVDSRYCG